MKNKLSLMFVAMFLFFIIYFASASIFVPPTLENNYQTNKTYYEANVSINLTTNPLNSFIWNWNGTNFTLYNDSLVLMMNFENRSALGENSTYVVDVSKYGNNGTVTGAVWNSSGKYGGGYSFDGVNDYISTSVPSQTYPLTIGMWVKPDVDDPVGMFDSAPGVAHVIRNYEAGKVEWWSNDPEVTLNLVAGKWVHLVFIFWYDGNRHIDYYKNGVLQTSASGGTTSTLAWTTFRLGSVNNVDYPFNGSIDEVRIYNRSLSAEEIYELYASNLQKFNSTNWGFYVNQSKNATTGLSNGTYSYQAFAMDSASNSQSTELRNVTVNTSFNGIQTDTIPPQINFTYPTPDNGTTTANTSIPVNVSIFEESGNLSSFIWNWNGTNYTLYNDSLVLMMNFENRSALGENSTYVVDISKYGNNGTVNGATWNATGGKYGGAYEFDGVMIILI